MPNNLEPKPQPNVYLDDKDKKIIIECIYGVYALTQLMSGTREEIQENLTTSAIVLEGIKNEMIRHDPEKIIDMLLTFVKPFTISQTDKLGDIARADRYMQIYNSAVQQKQHFIKYNKSKLN